MRKRVESKVEQNISKAIKGIKEDISKLNNEYPPLFDDVKTHLVKKDGLPDYYTNIYLYQILGTVVSNHILIIPDGGDGNHKIANLCKNESKKTKSNKYK